MFFNIVKKKREKEEKSAAFIMFQLCVKTWVCCVCSDGYLEAPSWPRPRVFTSSGRLRDLFAVSAVIRVRHLLDAHVALLTHALYV